jgi:alkylation response protein AidB-like acyl-CoA dehydrogenase
MRWSPRHRIRVDYLPLRCVERVSETAVESAYSVGTGRVTRQRPDDDRAAAGLVDFELNDEQAMLKDVTRSLLGNHCSIAAVRAGLDAHPDADTQLWALGAELGWPGLALPEEHGGSGQGLVELAIVAEELGRALARVPVLTSAVVGAAVARGGSERLQAATLPALADGTAWASWAFAEPSQPWSLDGVTTTARADGDSHVLDGVKTAVAFADGARWLLVTARLDSTPTSFLVDRAAPGISVRRQAVLDLTRSFYEVRLDGVRVPSGRCLDGGAAATQRLLDDAAVLGCAEALGTMDRMCELTVAYAGVRVQFGAPIGSFQAVKHGAADMAVQVLAARAAIYYAAMAADAGTVDAARAACVAASYVSAATGPVAGEALQLHGGIGFTWEHDLHLYLRRAKVDGVLHGDAALHRERLCRLLSPDPQPV